MIDAETLGRRLAGWVQENVPADGLSKPCPRHHHVGATLVETVLQARARYDRVVRPRVERVLRLYPRATNLSAFRVLVNRVGPENVLCWKGPQKTRLFIDLLNVLSSTGVQTERELAAWLCIPRNTDRLLAIRGVGHKTVDYLSLLVGLQTVPVDVHLRRLLLSLAELDSLPYQHMRVAALTASTRLGCEPASLAWALWRKLADKVSDNGARGRTRRKG